MSAWQFMSESPILTFFLAMILAGIVRLIVWLCATPFRAMNIRKHGWPPPYLDADGDHKSTAQEQD